MFKMKSFTNFISCISLYEIQHCFGRSCYKKGENHIFSDKFEGVFIQIGEDDPEEDKLVHVDVKGVGAGKVVLRHEGEEDGGEQRVPESVRAAPPTGSAQASCSWQRHNKEHKS